MPIAPTPRAAAAALLVAALAGAPLVVAAPAGAQQSLTPEAFLDLADGRTLTFVDGETDALVGVEQFLGRDRTVWARADGTCAFGLVTVRGPEVCFEYDDDGPDEGPHCWWPLREGFRLYVRLADAERESRQRIAAITDEPVACAGNPGA